MQQYRVENTNWIRKYVFEWRKRQFVAWTYIFMHCVMLITATRKIHNKLLRVQLTTIKAVQKIFFITRIMAIIMVTIRIFIIKVILFEIQHENSVVHDTFFRMRYKGTFLRYARILLAFFFKFSENSNISLNTISTTILING